MKLNRHFIIKNTLIHTFKQLKIKNKSIFLVYNLPLVENSYLFENVEDDIRRYISEQHLQRIYMKVLITDHIDQIRTKK